MERSDPRYLTGGKTQIGVDRGAELAQVTHLLTESVRSVPGIGCIEGSIGLGKTSVLQETIRTAKDFGFRILSSRASATETGFGLGVVTQLFEPSSANPMSPPPDTVLCCGEVGSCRHQGELSEQRILQGLYRAVRVLAGTSPVLIAVDDVEHADLPSLNWLAYLRRRFDELPVAVVVTRGSAHDDHDPGPLREVISGATRIGLTGLDPQACARMLVSAYGGPVANEFAATCHEVTAGNPHLLRELLRELRAANLPPSARTAADLLTHAPSEISREMLSRLRQGGPEAPELFRAVAVLTTANLELATAAAGIPRDSAGKAAQTAVGLGLCTPGETIALVHPLVRGAVVNGMTAVERSRIHARAAQFLREGFAPAGHIARHLLEAEPIGEPWAQSSLREAAEHAMADGAPAEAIRYLNRLLREPLPEDARGEVLVELGEAQCHVDPQAALGYLTKAADQNMEAPAEGRMALALAYGLGQREMHGEAVATLENAITRVAVVDPDLAQRLDLAALCLGMEESYVAPAVQARMRRLLTTPMTSARNERLFTVIRAFHTSMVGGHAGTAMRLLHASGAVTPRKAGEPGGRQIIDQWSFAYAVVTLLSLDELELARRLCADAIANTAERDLPVASSLILGLQCHVAGRLGLLREAEAAAVTSLKQLDGLGIEHGSGVVVAVSGLVAALIEQGELRRAAELLAERGLDDELPEFAHYDTALHQRGKLRAALGDHEGALHDQLECGRLMENRGARNAAQPWLGEAALAYARLGDRDSAIAFAQEQLQIAREWGKPTELGIALRVAGLVTGGETGAELLSESVAALQRSQAKTELAHSLVEWGGVLRDRERRAEACASLRRAHELAKAAGAIPLMSRAASELRAAGGRSSRAGHADPTTLTEQEQHVASRAAQGLTNREIASELFVSSRAVEMYLTRAYRKLGIQGRRQLTDALNVGAP
ncbi:LuxR C-terminal-related transcriptional regulator [Amycolatopsis sp. cg5]|uniref:ATP-binding protein n=1 Tax=Amycolatopsis sp. cg5 TaxID=3238802 RepID=UPI0035257A2B